MNSDSEEVILYLMDSEEHIIHKEQGNLDIIVKYAFRALQSVPNVMITDLDDFAIFHAVNGEIIFPSLSSLGRKD